MKILSFFRSIRFRLTIWYSSLLTIFLIVFAAITYGVVSTVLRDQQVTLSRETVQLEVTDPTSGTQLRIEVPQNLLRERLQTLGCPPDVRRPDPRCRPIANELREDILNQSPAPGAGQGGQQGMRQQDYIPGEQPPQPSVQKTDVVRVGFEEGTQDRILGALLHFLKIAIPLIILISLLGGYLLARQALAPIGAIVASAKRIQKGDLKERIRLTGPEDELRQLASTFDEMIDELQLLFEREKRFASDASHELQTPLTIIRTSAEVALSENNLSKDTVDAFEGIVESTDRISRIVDDLLILSSYEQQSAKKEKVKLNELLAGTVKHLNPLAEKRGVSLALKKNGEIEIYTASDRLDRAVTNLIENAIKYSDDGNVDISAVESDQQVEIAITDNGQGIDPEHISHIFDRFYRVDKARDRATGGTGLGLAIVQAAIVSLGGSIRVDSSPESGSTFTISLPKRANQ